jgi:hypothetical protein
MKTAIAILILALAGGAAIMLAGGAAMAQSLVPQGPSSQSLVPSSAASRYSMQPVDGGVARLDTQTGEISLCQVDSGQIACEPSEDERQRLEDRIRELSDEVASLKEGRPDDGDAATPLAGPRKPQSVLPEDADLDKALGQMKHIFRTFRDIARELDDEKPVRETTPDRT